MYVELFALNEGGVLHFLKDVRATLEGDRQRMWPFLYRSMEAFRNRGSLSLSNSPQRPLTHVSYHTSPDLGWKDLAEDDRPMWADPRLGWVFRQMVLGSCDMCLHGRDSRFYYAFSDWLPKQKVIQAESEQVAWRFYCDRLFFNADPLPEELWFLETDPNRAYWPPSVVTEVVARERQVPFLEVVAERLAPQGDYGRIVGAELSRIKRFLDLAAVEGAAVYYREPRT